MNEVAHLKPLDVTHFLLSASKLTEALKCFYVISQDVCLRVHSMERLTGIYIHQAHALPLFKACQSVFELFWAEEFRDSTYICVYKLQSVLEAPKDVCIGAFFPPVCQVT